MVHFFPNSLDKPSTQKNWGANQKGCQESILFDYSRKRCNKTTPSIQLITMERMISTCIAAPDIDAYHEGLPLYKHHCYIFMKKKEEWNSIFFFNHMRKELDPNRKCDDVSDDEISLDPENEIDIDENEVDDNEKGDKNECEGETDEEDMDVNDDDNDAEESDEE